MLGSFAAWGPASEHASISLARVAEEEGADGLLMPPPFFFPYAELISAIFLAGQEDRRGDLHALAERLQRLIVRLDVFPTPWGLKWLLQARNVIQATFSQPLSEERLRQGSDMMSWFSEDLRRHNQPDRTPEIAHDATAKA